MWTRRLIGLILVLGLLTGAVPAARAADLPDQFDLTPPRLSYADGNVSFWRQGADDWAPAQVNTPLAPGDELYTSSPANLEIQIGPRAFVRTWANTQLGLVNQEPDFLQFKVTSGSAAFDLRSIEPGTTVEVATPNAALTIEHPGYYRVDITGDRTSFITRRSGQATVTPASGEAVVITPSEEVVIEGTSSPRVTSYVAPPLDGWDKWNYARSDTSLDTLSARYVSPGTYGVSDLDRYGTWRAVPDYGTVWIPTTVQPGWAPYTTGSWTLDPTYGWTWVDTAPWGWAPYHYGRWVSVNGFWGWAPGPVIARPVYAPALVAFLGGPAISVGINIGGPVLGWVALGWGEPVVPWWGRPGVARQPSWRGWGGPHVVNDVVVNNTTVVNVQNINVYRNTNVRNAVVVVNENRFGRGPITGARISRVDVKDLRPTHAAPQVTATPASFVPTAGRGARPPEASLKRSVVATRPSRVGPSAATATTGGEPKAGPPGSPTPAPRIVSAPSRREPDAIPARPPLGQSNVERRTPDRAEPSTPPKPPVARQAPPPARREPQVAAPVPAPTPPVATPVTTTSPRGRAPEKPEITTPSTDTSSAPAAPVTRPTPPGRRPERPQASAPSEGAPQSPVAPATSTPPPARRAEPPQVAPPSAAPVTAPPAPARRPEKPQAAVPTPAAPPSVAAPTTQSPPQAAPPSAAPATAPTPPARRVERPQAAAPTPVPPPAVATPATKPPPQATPPSATPATKPVPPALRAERPQAAAPTPVPPSAVAAPSTTPAPPARRPAAAAPPARQPLPGEPANQLSPNRTEKQ